MSLMLESQTTLTLSDIQPLPPGCGAVTATAALTVRHKHMNHGGDSGLALAVFTILSMRCSIPFIHVEYNFQELNENNIFSWTFKRKEKKKGSLLLLLFGATDQTKCANMSVLVSESSGPRDKQETRRIIHLTCSTDGLFKVSNVGS